MTRKTDAAATAPSNRTTASLRNLRSHLDKIDQNLLKLLNERASLAAELGKTKNEHATEVFSAAGEEEVLRTLLEANKGPLDPSSVRAIFREVLSGCRTLQRVFRVAYVGSEYGLSHLAALERFGQGVEFIRVGSVAAVFEEVNRGHTDYGIVPLESSSEGRVSDTLDMFLRLPQLKVVAEVRLRVHHNLLANCDQQEIRRIYGQSQALSQCRSWLSRNVPHASLHEVASTATAAELAQREPGAAAVASRQVAVRYSLRVLFTDIEDSPYTEARYAVIGTHEVPRSGHDKTAVMFKIGHQPGSLVDALGVFRGAKLNLTWIESFPAKPGKPESVFFVEFEGHVEDPKVKKALMQLREQAEEVSVLGSFPISEPTG